LERALTRVISFVAMVLFGIISARLIAHDRRFVIVVFIVLAAFLVPAWLARRRMEKLLLSGDVDRIVGAFGRSLSTSRHGATMAPLVDATTYAAYGFIDEARNALDRAARGPAWEAAVEQRLFVEALLDVYEGERDRAMSKATVLEGLPLPEIRSFMAWRTKRKVAIVRRGVAAFARAFAHASQASDEAALRDAGRSSPLVHWAMRYARAVFLIDRGRKEEARDLLTGAPPWPEKSAFRMFHDELSAAAVA
jgi:hypothetical protein